jgi:hypothetical protein
VLLVVLAMVVGVGVFLLGGNNKAGASEIQLQAKASVGPNPFTLPLDVGLVSPSSVPTPTPTGQFPVVTADVGGGTVLIYEEPGPHPQCDKAKLIQSLQQTPAKAAAWAGVERIPVQDIPTFVKGLFEKALRFDTRVTNHGYVRGIANPFQAVLEAGTAVLINSDGAPLVRCKSGSPLTRPIAVPGTPQYTGASWAGFQPEAVITIVVQPLGTAPSPPQTPAPTTSPSPSPPPSVDLLEGGVESATASSTYDSNFPASLGIDGDPRTSWFNSGPDSNGTSTFTITLKRPSTITEILFIGNARNSIRADRQGFGFRRWRIRLIDSAGKVLYTVRSTSPATAKQMLPVPSVPGVVVLKFIGFDSESESFAGFGDIHPFAVKARH